MRDDLIVRGGGIYIPGVRSLKYIVTIMRVLLSWILMVKMGQLFMQMDILMDKVIFLLKNPKMKCMRMTTLVFYAEGSWRGQGRKRYPKLGLDYFPTILLFLTVTYILNWYTAFYTAIWGMFDLSHPSNVRRNPFLMHLPFYEGNSFMWRKPTLEAPVWHSNTFWTKISYPRLR